MFKSSDYSLKLCLILATFIIIGCKSKSNESSIGLTGDPAIDAITESIDKNPNDPTLYYQRAETFYQKQAYDQAIEDLAQVMRIDSMNLPAHHLLADVYLDDFQSALALTTLQRASSLYPDSINTKLKLSEFQLILKQYDAAMNTLADIMKIHPGDPEALFMLGMVYKDQGKTDQAIAAFQSAVERNPDMAEAWVILGDLMDRTHNPLAGQYFDNAIRVDPSNIAAWHAKAYYLQNNEKVYEAIEIYKKIHSMDPQYAEAYLNSAILLMYQDSLNAAMSELDILEKIDPSNAATWFYKGKIYHFKGQKDLAKSAYEQALRLDQDYEQAKDGLRELESE
ncbi:MAG: tetratricopeptide repeat protein [Bacteroidota bacterium]|nr:tetratricopeptide repeat protein [Bacteroidota bacterium]